MKLSTYNANRKQRVGIYGGAFNPFHAAHLYAAEEACIAADLDRIVIVPTGEQCYREHQDSPGGEARAEMCEAAVANYAHFEVDRFEIAADDPEMLTYEMLQHMQERFANTELFLIVGSDQAWKLSAWRNLDRIVSLAKLIVVTRDGDNRMAVAASVRDDIGRDAIVCGGRDNPNISSTLVRETIANGVSTEKMLSPNVLALIEERSYYGFVPAISETRAVMTNEVPPVSNIDTRDVFGEMVMRPTYGGAFIPGRK